MNFDFYPLRFCFVAGDEIYFPAGKPGNILRGAFGSIFKKHACVPSCRDARTCELRERCPYARIFEPQSRGEGPSGLADWPRPFVFRASHLDGVTATPGQAFHFDLHVFEVREPALAYFVTAFAQIAREGLGSRRGRAHLASVWQLDACGDPRVRLFDVSGPFMTPAPVSLPLDPAAEPVEAIRIDFVTPTELKSGDELAARPDFPVLFARVRDRISMLRALYGGGPLEIDFKALGEKAAAVRMTRCDLRQVAVMRRSARTGRVHSLGGFVGSADYEGGLAGFLPYLQTAFWTGVGRQTVWGKGEIRTTIMREC